MTCYLENHKKLLKPIIYYGLGDYLSIDFAQNIIDHLDSLESEMDSLNCSVVDLYSLYQYLWTISLREFSAEVHGYNLPESAKLRIQKLGSAVHPNNGSFVTFVNENYTSVFSKTSHGKRTWHWIFRPLLKLVYGKFSSSIKSEVFLFIEKAYPSILVAEFDICKKYYKPKEMDANFELLFSKLDKLEPFCDLQYVDFLNKIGPDYKKEITKEKANLICSRALLKIKEVMPKGGDEAAEGIFRFEDYYKLARLFKLACVTEYSRYTRKINEAFDKYVEKNGVSTTFGPIDLTSVMNELKKQIAPQRFLLLTHGKRNDQIANLCDAILELKQSHSLTESFAEYGRPRSSKYPYFKQTGMEIFLSLQKQIMVQSIIDEELSVNLSEYILTLCNAVEKDYFRNEIEIKNEYCGAFDLLRNILAFHKSKQGDIPLTKALENGLCVNLCGTIEKVLRNVLTKEAEDNIYLDPDSITLGQIFDHGDAMTSISSGLKYFLEFYLSKENSGNIQKADRPGKDIRNVQMHNHDEKYEATNYDDCLLLFYLALSLLSDLFIASANDVNLFDKPKSHFQSR